MRRVHAAALAATAVLLAGRTSGAQAQMETSRAVSGGGISMAGWMGKIDSSEVAAGQKLENARLAPEGAGMRVTTGPATTYWHPRNVARGNYTVKATFTEPRYMSLNSHPHPYGLVVGGSDMGTDAQSYLYCAAYGNGNVIVRGFGPAAFQLNGRRGAAHPAVNKAAGPGEPVTQEIAISVTDDAVSCSVNGAVVGTYPRSEVVMDGRLRSTDGVYGVRFGHNTDAIVTGLTMTPATRVTKDGR